LVTLFVEVTSIEAMNAMHECEEKTCTCEEPRSAFDRLPEHVKAKLIAKEQNEARTAETYKKRQLKRAIVITIIGTLVYLVFGLVMSKATTGLMVLHCVLGAGVSCFVTLKCLGVIPSALLFGGTAITLSIVGYMMGKVDITGGIMGFGAIAFFCAWLMFIGIGAFIGYWLENTD
jgi:hypothetical protein